jgi:nucleoside-diphosphate-sugar epimerase
MRIAVTGGNGRVGQAVIELALRQGHSIINIDRQQDTYTDSDVTRLTIDTTNYAAFEAALQGSDALIHLAAITSPGRHPDHIVHNNNVVSSYNALRAAVEVGITRVCQASSINATGGVWSRWPHYDYFPLDENHPTYNEDPYSLSKWICELQADSIVRRYEQITIASLRIHGVVADPVASRKWRKSYSDMITKHLWGYTSQDATARACLLGLTADFNNHETFYIVAPQTMMDEPSLALKEKHFPEVSITGDLSGRTGFYNCQKAEKILGWQHNLE